MTENTTESNESNHGTELLRTTPTLKPALFRLAVTVVVGVVVIGILFTNPELLGSVEVTNVTLVIAQVLLVIAVVRLVVEIMILRNTEYIVTDRLVTRQYSLLGRTKSREVPHDLVRSTERSQGRIEYLLDVGSVALNQGLGDLTLTYLPNHNDVYRTIREQVENA